MIFANSPRRLKHHGFDEHCVWPGAEAGHPETEERFWNGHIITNGQRSTESYGPDTINTFVIDFVKRKKRKPFLVYYPMLLDARTSHEHAAEPRQSAR